MPPVHVNSQGSLITYLKSIEIGPECAISAFDRSIGLVRIQTDWDKWEVMLLEDFRKFSSIILSVEKYGTGYAVAVELYAFKDFHMLFKVFSL